VFVSIPSTKLGTAAKPLKESDFVMTQPDNIFGGDFFFKKVLF